VKRALKTTSIIALLFAAVITLNARTTGGKSDNFHYGMNLCLQHTSDNAKVLFDQASKGELNPEMVKDLVEQIGKDLDHARVYHARLHKTYTESETQMIVGEHSIILQGHTKAADAFALLKAELEKPKPDNNQIKLHAAAIFDGASKAAAAHLEAMKKLGITEIKTPAL
jgi:hypothetical protein